MKTVHLITVGKLKEKSLIKSEQNFTKRITDFSFTVHEVKTHDENLDFEAKEVLKKIKNLQKTSYPLICLLKEQAKTYTSKDFTKRIYSWLESYSEIFFIIGGSSGHGESIIEKSQQALSLSPMTYPHQFARVLFIEQLYRAQSIFNGHPYSK